MLSQQIILERYRVIERAGRGGYATVLHAYDTLLKRDVAIKQIEISADDLERARAQASMRVRPNAILPDGLEVSGNAEVPDDPSFLDRRDARKASGRGRGRASAGSRRGSSEPAGRAGTSASAVGTREISALAGQLPGVISGAGNVQIGAVDGNGVELDLDDLVPLAPREVGSDEELPVINIVDGTQSTVLPVLDAGSKKDRQIGRASCRDRVYEAV